jgi:hypothetical protein
MMTCEEFREWSAQLVAAQPVLDRLPAGRGHAQRCAECRQGLERRVSIEAWEAERRAYWRRRARTATAPVGRRVLRPAM